MELIEKIIKFIPWGHIDFLTLREKYDEKELEDALINQIT